MTPGTKRRGFVKRVARIALGMAVVLLLAGFAGSLWLRSELTQSLPRLDGELVLAGLAEPVRIERDALGVPKLIAANRRDLALATGFVHGQERFFQMDMLRRSAAGELAAILGSFAVPLDERVRLHRFRSVARNNLEALAPEDLDLLQAYTDGVNAGLAALRSRPPEYLALRADRAPWLPEDSVLVTLAMFITLQDDHGRRESSRGLMRDLLPEELYEFLVPAGTEWDAPIAGPALPGPPPPGPEVFDLRATQPPASARTTGGLVPDHDAVPAGSNNWAVAGTHTADGGALLANDMHLGHGMPNIWYRATLSVESTVPTESLSVTGVTLPGTPTVTVGSNGRVAWGFTNSHGDWLDLVLIETDADDENRYRTPNGWLPFERYHEPIEVKGSDPVEFEVVSTIWGPIVDRDYRNRPRALRWVAYDRGAANVALLEMERARDVDEAMAIAARTGIPTQNVVLADASGRIAWTLMGPLPRRVGFDGRFPTSWADGNLRWDGWLEPREYPRVVDPETGRIWSANNRIVGAPMLDRIGDGGFNLGARAGQIRDNLLQLDRC